MASDEPGVTPTAAEMERTRIARFAKLGVIEAMSGHDIPQNVADLIWSRKLMPVIALGDGAKSAFGPTAPIIGAGGMTVTYAVCPAGTGPTLHKHHKTYETFTVMKGRFEFTWGDAGEERAELGPFDAVSMPPGLNRAFRNISDEEGILQVIITGGVHDMEDIAFPAATRDQIAQSGPQYVDYFKKAGLTFT